MTIEVLHANGMTTLFDIVKNYDFYPETRLLFVECDDDESYYVPINENVIRVGIKDGAERGYLEGHNEAG